MLLDEASARALARDNPRELIRILRDHHKRTPVELYFAAESAAYTRETGVVEVLVPLLKHPEPVVREGAARGLAVADDPSARVALQERAKSDPSEAVRIAAADALDRS